MCGIGGIVAYRSWAAPVDGEELLRVRESMARRGPDGQGAWISPDRRAALSHRRLAVIDLTEAASQPMASPDGRLRITFNGEIYNHEALRRGLRARGHEFRTSSDTEVLLRLYDERGADMLGALRGMYAFAIWDDARKEIFLARDPFGVKPLYISDDGGTLRFASQVKALAAGDVDLACDPAGAVGFLIWGHVPEPYTLHRGIRALPAGTWMRVRRDGAPVIGRHFDVAGELREAQDSPPPADSRDILRAALADSVRDHLVADVRVGVFLSAGLDSSTVAGAAAACSAAPIEAVTLAFDEYRGTPRDEVPLAAQTAARLGMSHGLAWICRRDFEEHRLRILEAMDQPTIDGVNTYFVSRAAAQRGLKVALSGLGGDELFGGYPSASQVPLAAAVLGFARALPFAGRGLRRALAPLIAPFTSPKYAGLLEYGPTLEGAYLLRRSLFMPWELRNWLDPATVRAGLETLDPVATLRASCAGLRSPKARVAALELGWYMRNQLLRDADWAGMAHSVEIRVPLVDAKFFRAIAPLLASGRAPSKADLAAALDTPPPQELMRRAKTGFTTPVREWTGGTAAAAGADRGLRAWALRVLPPQPRLFRALVLVTDAYGGNGGIAKFNRDFLQAVVSMPECAQVVAAPRLVPGPVHAVPERVRYVTAAAGGKMRFIARVLAEALRGPVDLVVAGHINLAPLARAVAAMKRAPAALVIHGIDAWTPHASALVRRSLPRFDAVVGVSRVTLERFSRWARVDESRLRILPNCVQARDFGPGPKPPDLVARYALQGRTVLITLGRLASGERYKGFDEVIEALPDIASRLPAVSYLVCGDGPDRGRLEGKARELGVADRVVFTGFVPEDRKADYYRLADAYVMPSQGEGFGIVFLEAMACGIPVVGSSADGGREALRDGGLGRLVDPSDREALVRAVVEAVAETRGTVPPRLAHYSSEAFRGRAAAILRGLLEKVPEAH